MKENHKLVLALIRKLQAEEGFARWGKLRELGEGKGIGLDEMGEIINDLIDGGKIVEPTIGVFNTFDL